MYIYMDAIMKTICPPSYHRNGSVATHTLGHMMYTNVSVTFIDKTGSKNLKRRKNYLKHTLKTTVPCALQLYIMCSSA